MEAEPFLEVYVSSRHVSTGWRYAASVIALVLLPAAAMHTLLALGLALFLMLTGVFAFADGNVVLMGAGFLAVALMMMRACWWMLRQRSAMLRTHRAILGGLLIVVALAAWMVAPVAPVTRKAVVSVAALYGIFGLSLAVHAWEDRWSP